MPPPVWSNLEAATVQGDNPETDGATLALVARPYRDQLVVDQFQLGLPADAQIEGIEVTLRRASDSPDSAADDTVRLVKGGNVGGLDRSRPQQWEADGFRAVTYGGATDLWGETWTVSDLSAQDFGVAVSVKYTQLAGNARAYVDLITVNVYYRVDCDE